MARIREYTQQTSVNSTVGGRNASAQDFGFGVNIQQFGDTLTDVGAYIRQDQERKTLDRENKTKLFKQEQERKEVDDAQVKMAEARQTWAENFMQRQNAMIPGDSTFAPTIRDEMKDYFGQMSEGFTSTAAKNYVKLHGTTMTTGFFTQGLQHQSLLAGQKAIEDVKTRKTADADTVYMNHQLYDIVKGSYQFDSENNVGTAFSTLKNDPRKQTFDREYFENLAKFAAEGWIQNPANRGFIAGSVRGGAAVTPQATFESSLVSIFKTEGGYVSNDGKRGATNFGINGQVNGLTPEQVKNLTPDQAAQIYKKNYWDKYGLDTVSPAAVPLVFDGVVNHRVEFANQLVTAAKNGATPQQLADMRKAEYTRLIQADPTSFKKYEKSWMKRVDNTLTEAGTVETQQAAPMTIDDSKLPSFFADMNPADKDRFLKEAVTLQNREKAVATQAVDRTVKDHAAELTLYGGKLRSPMLNEAAFGGDNLKWQAYQSMVKAGQEVQTIANASESVQGEMLKKLEPKQSEVPGVFSFQHELYRNAAKIIDASNKSRREDPMAFATSTGFSKDNPIQPIDSIDPQKLVPLLGVRDAQATAVSKAYNQGYRILTNGEADFLRQSFDEMDTRQQTDWIGRVRGSLPPEKFRSMITQMAKGDKALIAAGLVASSQYGGNTRELDAENIIMGRNAMTRILKGGGNEQERGFKAAGLPSATDAYKLAAKEMEGLLGVSEEQKGAMVEAAMAHYVGSSLRKNSFAVMDLSGPNTDSNRQEFKRSVEAIMPVSKVGAYSVLRPYGMQDSQFQEMMESTVSAKFGKERGTYSVMMTSDKYQLVVGGVAVGGLFDFQVSPGRSPSGRPPATVPRGVTSQDNHNRLDYLR